MINITIRNSNGKRIVIEGENESVIYKKINRFNITEEDEILLVSQDGMCLYSALGSDHSITIDDLTGFFG